jgi:hypothetical protein
MTTANSSGMEVLEPSCSGTLPAPLAQKLMHVLETRERALRILEAATHARSDLSFKLPERLIQLKAPNAAMSGHLSEMVESFQSVAAGTATPGKVQVNLRALLEATVEDLAITTEALLEVSTSVVKQLVGDPSELVSGSELAEMLGISEEAVRQRHQAGKLISVLRAGQERGRKFPVFQAWEGIAGLPLEQVLRALSDESQESCFDSAVAFQFFVCRIDLLGDFTPVEVLTGTGVPEPNDAEAAAFLNKPHQERLDFVMGVARTLAEAYKR